uniref:Uncharacterized protein n=1 Tax=Arundo donax TaxID=35708 RepID=A0A0A9GUP2_ARUDO
MKNFFTTLVSLMRIIAYWDYSLILSMNQ